MTEAYEEFSNELTGHLIYSALGEEEMDKCERCGHKAKARWKKCQFCGFPLFEEFSDTEKAEMEKINTLMQEYDRDQSAKADAGKEEISLVPVQIIREIAKVRAYRNKKYGDSESWKRVEIKRYKDALLRHTLAFIEDGDSLDEESGLPHLSHMACNIAFLCEKILKYK